MYVVTFYSFKGGVGRTLALLNVAYELADSGRRVLVVDFDLEAPGIRADRWRRPPNAEDDTDDIGTASDHPGIVEYVGRYLETMRVPRVADFIVDATPSGCLGRISVMPSGRMDDDYARRLNEIDWNDLYEHRHGYVMFEDTRAQWEQLGFDYVLLDSRTGFTDVGGICTRHLPDAVVTLFRPEGQSLAGMEEVVESIRAEGREAHPRRNHGIDLHFVMTGIPDADDDHGILEKRQKIFSNRLGIPKGACIEIRHYQSMDLLKQPIYAQHRPRTRLAASYRTLTEQIRESNIEDREGTLSRLRSGRPRLSKGRPDLGRDVFLTRIREADRYKQDAEVMRELADAYGHSYPPEPEYVVEALDRAAELEPLPRRHRLDLAQGRLATRDRDGARAAMKAFFQDEAEDPSNTADRAVDAGDVYMGLRTLEDLGEDRAGYVANSPIIRDLPVAERAEVATALDMTRSEAREAALILEDVIRSGDWSEEESSRWEWGLAWARMAAGCFDKALDYYRSSLEGPVVLRPAGETGGARSSVDSRVETAFNFAMAKWASRGAPDASGFAQVLELLGDDDGDRELEYNPNTFQAIAVAEWFAGSVEMARERIDVAEEVCLSARHVGNPISCWSYTRVSRDTFLEHCAEIRQLFNGEDVIPEFMRLAETSPATEAPTGE